ncbi:hypothetical protein [Streptosporangium sp. 'caverna']|uniref:hypothetical protein n=1 Tax=Streptosporangium sp. 'caverna' TaxID=2202249 RepID=UPI000D7DEB99|nr:hypothetical protein [Streptosporangium sp. 'caverna']AWS40342.1 hypothetical protein DKM19_02330 [Streptosporangium sp. 'caverna']
MHAVIGIWTVDPAWHDEQRRLLREEVIPLVTRQPGFLAGYWMHDPESGRSHTTAIFGDQESADVFKALVESGTRQAARVGLISTVLTSVEIVAHAGRQCDDDDGDTGAGGLIKGRRPGGQERDLRW